MLSNCSHFKILFYEGFPFRDASDPPCHTQNPWPIKSNKVSLNSCDVYCSVRPEFLNNTTNSYLLWPCMPGILTCLDTWHSVILRDEEKCGFCSLTAWVLFRALLGCSLNPSVPPESSHLTHFWTSRPGAVRAEWTFVQWINNKVLITAKYAKHRW